MFQSTVKLVIFLAVLSLAGIGLIRAGSPQPVAQNDNAQVGAIEGRVLDSNGQPINGAIVLADRPDVLLRPMPRAWTNENGEFVINGLTPGSYVLHSAKEADGYPRTEFNFYDTGESFESEVSVSEHQPAPKVVIQRGPKAATLTGLVVDASTNQPLEHAAITVRRAGQPERFLRTGLYQREIKGGFRLLVPSQPFSLQVSAPGYEDWYYRVRGEKAQASALLLASGTTKNFLIALRPLRHAK